MITVLVPGILALAWLIDRADARHVADRVKGRTAETARRVAVAKAVAGIADEHKKLEAKP